MTSIPPTVSSNRPINLRAVRRLIRPQQWIKNVLILFPLLLSHQIRTDHKLIFTLLAIVPFCFGASAIYVCNDARDVDDDRRHPRKKLRPFASGELPTSAAPLIAGVLFAISLLTALLIPRPFIGWLLVYLGLSTAYSFWLKRKLLVDVIVLAGLYTLRLLAGGAAAQVEVSPWLLAFSSFLFLSLAYAKRYAELRAVVMTNAASRAIDEQEVPRGTSENEGLRGRGYLPEDLRTIESVGPASGYMAALVFALYIHNSELVTQLYHHPLLLWMICPLLLYWITRIWFLARRGSMHDDPLLFAMRDRVSWYTVALAVLLAILATI